MKLNVYKLECITNLHVGSGDFNYGVIDNEVERDCLSGNPVIHASGIKGALRDVAEIKAGDDEEKKTEVIKIFGGKGDNQKDTTKGEYKFFDAQLLSRPLRVSGSEEISSISVTTPEIINGFIDTLKAFGFTELPEKLSVDFEENGPKFYSNKPGVKIESDEPAFEAFKIGDKEKATLDFILGEDCNYALTKSFDDYKLPVIARNKLGDNKNLWYEEYVPHGSVFYMMIMCDGDVALDFSEPVQFGGNSSIGYGFTRVSKF
jgi:CRISPR-associated protein Cmr4